MSRWMVRPLTPNRSAKAVSVIPGSSRQAWAMASRRSVGLAGRLDRARPDMPAGRSSRLASAASATAAREWVADAGLGWGCAAAVTTVASDVAGWGASPAVYGAAGAPPCGQVAHQ
jgi:hypothetical protein